MFKISKKVQDRILDQTKNFQKIAEQQKVRDVSEADTVTLVKDILAGVFGYDKYQELTSEQQIKGTFCDLAVRVDGKIRYLIECKSAGVTLNASHLRQALNYGMNQGIEWVILTNAVEWRVYRIKFGQPPIEEELFNLDFLACNPKNDDDLQKLFMLCKEAVVTDALDTYHQVAQIFNKHTISVVLQSDALLGALRKELRRLFPELKIEHAQLSEMLVTDVLKRDAIDGDKYKDAEKRVAKAMKKLAAPAKEVKTQAVAEKSPANS
jgi:predicted type IV restriction endonuclease